MATINDVLLITVKASAQGAAQEFSKLENAAKRSGAEVNTLQTKSQLAGASIRNTMAAAATGLVGIGLGAWALSAADAFVRAQDAAAQFARATNASVEEAGKFTMVAGALGLDMNDLIEINAEFSRKIEEQPQLLEQLNVQVAKNADGSTNMTQTLVATIDALGGMEDGLKAAQIAAQLFGEEGSKQLAGFYLAGIDVQRLMDRINFTNGSKEALKFKAATTELNLAWQQFQITVGAKLVPVLTAATDVATGVVTALGGIPAPLAGANLALIAGALAWSRWGDSLRSVGSQLSGTMLESTLNNLDNSLERHRQKLGQATDAYINHVKAYGANAPMPAATWKAMNAQVDEMIDLYYEHNLTRMDRAKASVGGFGSAVGSAMTGLVSALGPANIALLALTAATVAYGAANANFEQRVNASVLRLRELESQGSSTADALSSTAKEMEGEANIFENYFAALTKGEGFFGFLKSGGGPYAFIKAAGDAFREGGDDVYAYEKALEKAREEAGEYGVVTTAATASQSELNEMLATGEYNAQQLAEAVKKTADAQYEKNQLDETSRGLIETQLDSTKDAVKAVRESISASHDYADALDSYAEAAKAACDAEKALNEAKRSGSDSAIATAERDYAKAKRDVAAAALEAADAYVEQQRQADQLSGVYRDSAFYTNLAVGELVRLRDAASTPTEAAAITEIITQIQNAQKQAGEGIFIPLTVGEVGDINAKVADLKARIAAAAATGDMGLKRKLESELWEVDPGNLPARIQGAIAAGDMGLATKLTSEYNAWAAGTGLPSAKLVVDADTGAAEIKVGGLTESKTVPVTVTVDGVDGAKKEVEALAVPKETTISWNTEFKPGGFNAVKSRLDDLTKERRGEIDLVTSIEPGGYNAVKSRIDYLTRQQSARIAINVDFEPGSYQSILDRINNIAKNRSATIRLNTVTTGGGSDKKDKSLAEERMQAFPAMTANYSPTNIFRINLEGTPLRAMIREEVAMLQPMRQEVG